MKESLHPDLNVGRDAAVLRALCQAEAYRGLMDESGWLPEEYEA